MSLLEWLADTRQTTSADETDRLIERCLQGEEAAYAALYHRYANMIYRLTLGLLQERRDAEEVLQDAFEYAFRRLDRFDPAKASFKTWLYQIAISRSRNKRRRKMLPQTPLDRLIESGHEPAATGILPDAAAVLSDRQLAVWDAIGQLSPKLREVALLRYFGGLRYAEIGQILNIPSKTAESRMRLAHKALRQQLSDSV